MTAHLKRPTAPRIPPIDTESMTENRRTLAGIGASNVVRTLVRHEDLFGAWITLGAKLLFSERLSPRERELAILRVALRTRCEYEWANHVAGALSAGATEGDIQALADESASWSNTDAAVLHAVDELCSDDCLSDATWAALAVTHDDVQIIELLAVIGYYRMNAGLLNSIGVQPEPGRPHLGQLPRFNGASAAPSPAPRTPGTEGTHRARVTEAATSGLCGTWQIVFHHPAGDQDLTLVLDTSGGAITGSVTNPMLRITLPIIQGTVDNNRFSFRAPMQTPVQVDIAYAGSVRGDAISGDVTVQGGGTFPFAGVRA